MRLIIATLTILGGLGLIHFIHGPGCWGLQPGGIWTGCLYSIQSLITLGACIYSLLVTFGHRRRPMVVILGLVTATLFILAAWQYHVIGWRMYSSIHHQGPENLPTFLLSSATAIVAGIQALVAQHAKIA